ncbi:MAG: copper resistance protein CopC/CopD, partial [Pyrinomonadaceae bacterium]|nr:copper resistance protein CopC/CopD [Pyrinomonadaceae bacterium]
MRLATKTRHRLRLTALGLVLLLAVALLTPAVSAHAKLLRSEPKGNSTVPQAPTLVELWFSEELETRFNTIEVKDQQGKRVDRGEVSLSEENKKAQVALDGLGAGTYTVVWKVLSMDEHTLRGTFSFTVAQSVAPAGTEASPANATDTAGAAQALPHESPMDSMPSAKSEEGYEISPGHSAVRWLSYLAMMTLFGGFAFYLLVLAPALRQVSSATGTDDLRVTGARRIVILSWVGLILLAVMSFVALAFQASGVFDKSLSEALSPSLLGQVITDTGYGGHWLLEILSVVVLAVILFILSSRLKQAPAKGHKAIWWAGLLASAVLLIAPSWTGHAVAAVKDYRLAVVTDWLHLLAGGFWVGGLFHLALTLPSVVAGFDKARRISLLHEVIKRFTRIAMPAVA